MSNEDTPLFESQMPDQKSDQGNPRDIKKQIAEDIKSSKLPKTKTKTPMPKVKEPKKMGRPTKFNDETIEEFLNRIIEGDSLRTICSDPKMPGLTTVMSWLSNKEDFQKQYARAKELQIELKMDTLVDIARTAKPDNVQCVRLEVDTLKWEASKLIPKKYGHKQEIEMNATVDSKEHQQAVMNAIKNKHKKDN